MKSHEPWIVQRHRREVEQRVKEYLQDAPIASPQDIERYLLEMAPHPRNLQNYRVWMGEVAIATLTLTELTNTQQLSLF